MKLIAISGTNGSGKDTIGHALAADFGFMFISLTDMLRDELTDRKQPLDRPHMRELSAEWRRAYGLGVLVDRAVAIYKKTGKGYKGLAVASLRNTGEVDLVHELGGVVIWVDADAKIRYERVQKNKHLRGEHRAVDDQISFEEFLEQEKAEMHYSGDEATLNMSGVKDEADIFLQNDGHDIAEFKQLIADKIVSAKT